MQAPKKKVDIHQDRYKRRLKAIQSFQAKHYKKRSKIEKIIDRISTYSGSIPFLGFNILFFGFWLLWNTKFLGVKPFDPFPFVLLTSIVSLEAIILAIFVLISQNRQAHITDLRQEVDLQINLIAEEEVTKVIHLLAGLYEALKIQVEADSELKTMLQPTDWEEIEKRLENQLQSEQ